jgi:hypothetical protein
MAIIPSNTQFVGDTTGIPIKQLRSAQINAMSEPFTMGDIIDTVAVNVGDITGVASTAPLSGGGTTGSVTIGIDQSSAVQDGYLSSTDWTTFNNKGDITGSGTASKVTKWTAAGAIGNSLLNDNGLSVWNTGTGTGANNTSFGRDALISNTTGYENTAFGDAALRENLVGYRNTAIGRSALVNSKGSNNMALGFESLLSNTTGNSNTAVGMTSAFRNVSGSNNTAIGIESLYNNQTGTANTAVGQWSLYNNTASNNVALGAVSAFNNTSGVGVTAIGASALYANTTGAQNTAVGSEALSTNTTGGGNTAIGVLTSSGNFNGSVILGYEATATADNQFVVGSSTNDAGAVTAETNTSANVWNVVINGVARKILLA